MAAAPSFDENKERLDEDDDCVAEGLAVIDQTPKEIPIMVTWSANSKEGQLLRDCILNTWTEYYSPLGPHGGNIFIYCFHTTKV
jgi:hypothetical protein